VLAFFNYWLQDDEGQWVHFGRRLAVELFPNARDLLKDDGIKCSHNTKSGLGTRIVYLQITQIGSIKRITFEVAHLLSQSSRNAPSAIRIFV
jgi:hypothetical protein